MSNSKQLNFFITPDDYKLIDDFLVERGAIILTDSNIEKRKDLSISLDDLEETKQIFLTRKDFLDKVVIKKVNNLSYYYITSSFILEFSLGGFYPYDMNSLQAGRFYFIKAFYDEDSEFVYKSDDFINWCDEIFKNFKKIFLKKYSKNYYCSESAIKWIESNNAILNNGGQQWSIR